MRRRSSSEYPSFSQNTSVPPNSGTADTCLTMASDMEATEGDAGSSQCTVTLRSSSVRSPIPFSPTIASAILATFTRALPLVRLRLSTSMMRSSMDA